VFSNRIGIDGSVLVADRASMADFVRCAVRAFIHKRVKIGGYELPSMTST